MTMLAGRDLDAAVATALGRAKPATEGWPPWPPAYSTSAMHLPEMVSWLNAKYWRVVLTQRVSGFWDATACAIADDGERLYAADEEVETCQSIQHAIANLVVAVAKAREAQ